VNQTHIRHYLLGELSEEEMDAFEVRYFENPGLAELIDAVSDDICVDFIRGRLSPRQRARVQALAASSPWRERLEFAEALTRKLDAPTIDVASSRPRFAPSPRVRDLVRAVRAQSRFVRIGIAAAIIAAISGWPVALQTWSTTQTRLDLDRDAMRRQSAALEQSLAAERARGAKLQRVVDDQGTVRFALFENVRNAASGNTLVVPAAAAFVRFEFATPATPLEARVSVEVSTPDGRVVSSQVDAASSAARVATIRVPASVLPTGSYRFRVFAVRQGKSEEELGRFAAQIIRR
jgi:hypothetical protein